MSHPHTAPPANAKRMICAGDGCGTRILATIEQAKRHGWKLWVGGALCKRCAEAEGKPETLADTIGALTWPPKTAGGVGR